LHNEQLPCGDLRIILLVYVDIHTNNRMLTQWKTFMWWCEYQYVAVDIHKSQQDFYIINNYPVMTCLSMCCCRYSQKTTRFLLNEQLIKSISQTWEGCGVDHEGSTWDLFCTAHAPNTAPKQFKSFFYQHMLYIRLKIVQQYLIFISLLPWDLLFTFAILSLHTALLCMLYPEDGQDMTSVWANQLRLGKCLTNLRGRDKMLRSCNGCVHGSRINFDGKTLYS